MPLVDLGIRDEAGARAPGRGQLTTYSDSARFRRAALFLGAGILGGAMFIVVPILHLFTTWALPLAGLLAAVHAVRTRGTVTDIRGACPACETEITLEGGRAEFPLRDACTNCHRPLLIIQSDPA